MKLKKIHVPVVIFLLLFGFHVFIQFSDLPGWIRLGFDQVDNGWAAIRIVIEHNYPLVGMVAKNNSGIYIGPLYYYLVALFYWLTNFHPIASPLLAAISGLLSFAVLYVITKKIFNTQVALWALFIHVFSIASLIGDKTQWPVNFIAPIGLLVFYFLYRILMGNPIYLIHLAATVGLSAHIHFTSIFYPIIIICSFPFFPRRKETLFYSLLGLPLFSIFLIPNIIYEWTKRESGHIGNMWLYINANTHGFHLRRLIQIAHDAFIQFQVILPIRIFRPLVFFLAPLFSVLLYITQTKKGWFVISYLTTLWILIPWIVFTIYKGEITNYYFFINRFIAIMTVAYISWWLTSKNKLLLTIALIVLWGFYAFTNVRTYYALKKNNEFPRIMDYVEHAQQKGDVIPYEDGNLRPFLYYIWRWKHGLSTPQ